MDCFAVTSLPRRFPPDTHSRIIIIVASSGHAIRRMILTVSVPENSWTRDEERDRETHTRTHVFVSSCDEGDLFIFSSPCVLPFVSCLMCKRGQKPGISMDGRRDPQPLSQRS